MKPIELAVHMSKRTRTLPNELINKILKYAFYKHELPFTNIIKFNQCLSTLPKVDEHYRMKRYKRLPGDEIFYHFPIFYKTKDRIVQYYHTLEFNSKKLSIHEYCMEHF